LVLPDGYYKSWNAGECCKPAAKLGVRDVRFIENLVDKIAAEYCIDRDAVFATGFSNGAMLAHRIACEKPGLLKAIAPVAGGIMSECENGGSVAALLIGGKKDPRIFWEGGDFDGSYRPSMKELVKNLSGRNQCGSAEKLLKKSSTVVECHELSSCSKQPLRYCGVEGVGHQWPGGKTFWPKKLGPNTQAFDATEEIFNFFSQL
ncbi:MAG: alpha/beta hydrolase family esterase, partial [Oceanococcus sp.]